MSDKPGRIRHQKDVLPDRSAEAPRGNALSLTPVQFAVPIAQRVADDDNIDNEPETPYPDDERDDDATIDDLDFNDDDDLDDDLDLGDDDDDDDDEEDTD